MNITLKKIYKDTLPHMELDDKLLKVNQSIFDKTKANAFTSEGFSEYIKGKEINSIVVVGLMAEHCVYETIKGGLKLGYQMHIITDAIAGKSDQSKNKKLDKLKKMGVGIL